MPTRGSSVLDLIYGNGAHGALAAGFGIVNLSEDKYYQNLTIDTGDTINENNYRIYVRGRLTLRGTGTIAVGLGNPATVNVGGEALPPKSLGGGMFGGAGGVSHNGSTGEADPISGFYGGIGGNGGNGGLGSGGNGGIGSISPSFGGMPVFTARPIVPLFTAMTGQLCGGGIIAAIRGGMGGGGGAAGSGSIGAGGGAGGGVIFICANEIVFEDTASCQAIGGAGANAPSGTSAGGGGGGGGGSILLMCGHLTLASSISTHFKTTGGAGGNGAGGSGAPGTGGSGGCTFVMSESLYIPGGFPQVGDNGADGT